MINFVLAEVKLSNCNKSIERVLNFGGFLNEVQLLGDWARGLACSRAKLGMALFLRATRASPSGWPGCAFMQREPHVTN